MNMEKQEIVKVLEAVLLMTDNADETYLKANGIEERYINKAKYIYNFLKTYK